MFRFIRIAVRLRSGISGQLRWNFHHAFSLPLVKNLVAAISKSMTPTITTIIVILLFFGVSCVSNTIPHLSWWLVLYALQSAVLSPRRPELYRRRRHPRPTFCTGSCAMVLPRIELLEGYSCLESAIWARDVSQRSIACRAAPMFCRRSRDLSR
jgi:hypothetical protein